jgi:hypothetical protein
VQGEVPAAVAGGAGGGADQVAAQGGGPGPGGGEAGQGGGGAQQVVADGESDRDGSRLRTGCGGRGSALAVVVHGGPFGKKMFPAPRDARGR